MFLLMITVISLIDHSDFTDRLKSAEYIHRNLTRSQEWKMLEHFTINEMRQSMNLDALTTSHPIQAPIKHAEKTMQVVDTIPYRKGACVVKMIHSVLGNVHFRDGLRLYFKRHSYGNTVTADLWQAWEDVSGKDIAALMAMIFPLGSQPQSHVTRRT